MDNCLVIFRGSTETEVFRFPFDRLVYIEAVTNENWCRVYMAEPLERHFNPMEIPLLLNDIFTEIRRQIDLNHAIIPCGRSMLINPAFIRKVDVSEQTVILSDGINHFTLKPSRAACQEVRAFLRSVHFIK